MKWLLVCLLLIYSLTFVSAAMDPAPAFCMHQGYEMSIVGDSSALCIFNNTVSCDVREFYQGTCGKEHQREFRCVSLGEPAFEFDHCCEGQPYLPPYAIGQATCQSFAKRFTTSAHYYGSLIVILFIVLAIIHGLYRLVRYFVKKK